MRKDPDNRNRLSWWFPRIPPDILVPKTVIIPYESWGQNDEDDCDLVGLLDGQTSPPGFDSLCNTVILSGCALGWPMFLRTDFLSGKHSWKDTCCISLAKDVPRSITKLVEFSCEADMWGFPTDCWIARKMIPTTPAFKAFRGNMPIVKERRYFVQDDKVVCHHPYWPEEAFGNVRVSVDGWKEHLQCMNRESDHEIDLLSRRSSRVGAAIGGSWSIDWLWSEPECRWYLTDMAEADKSYHWSECPIEAKKKEHDRKNVEPL